MNPAFQYTIPSRGYAMVVARILRGALKIRYLILGGALGGGMTLQKVIYVYNMWQPLFEI
jgi:optic atrophy protein 1